ncbi:MAG TPA: outer membrane protein assembly factor BamA [Aestuariivirgaceae bacterium]|nr:outer membrane protein assembly factor BamA [Aestuariivirgaceae bacterium]
MRQWLVGILCVVLAVAAAPLAGGLSSPAAAQVVSNIVVEGNQRVESATVMAYMQVTPGEVATPFNINESIKALFQTGLFSDVRISRRNNTLVVQVEENPIINRVSFEGNSQLENEDLEKEVELRERTVFTRARVQSDVQRLIGLYRRSGYFAVQIEPKIIRLDQNRVNLVFEIREGTATRIARINFLGNSAFSDSQLRSVISTAETRWWRFFSTSDNYDPDRVAFDRELLRRHYLKNGYADFRVIAVAAELARDGESFFITFTVAEGPQYELGEIAINTGTTAVDPGRLQSAMTIWSGQRYDASKIDKTVEQMTVEAGRAGFAFARIEPNIVRDEANRTLNITFDIQEGPRVFIERIDIVGNVRTLDEVIRREVRLVEGDAYNRVLIERSRRRLTALDFFEKIDFQETQGSAPDRVVITIAVVEKSTGTLSFSAGYSTTEQVIGSISISERNLLGRGQFIRLQTSASFKRQSIDFSFTEPYFMGRQVSAGVDAFATRTDQLRESSFTTQQFGGKLRLGFPLSEFSRLQTSYGFTHRIIDVDNPKKVSLAIANSEGAQNISAAEVSYVFDTLDNPLRPTSGVRLELSETVAGLGGDVFYFGSEVEGYYFRPLLFEGVVLLLKGTAGHIEGWNGKEVPIIDRYFKGADSFRGFERAGVGPRMVNPASSRTDAIGGKTYAIGTVEVSFPVGLPQDWGIEGAVFSDFGTVFNAPEKSIPAGDEGCPGVTVCTVFDDAQLRAAVGAGVIWQSPFGPLRLDVAWPLVKADFDRTELVRFSVGTRF